MIDPDLLEKNTMAQEGLKLLAMSGILHEQQLALKERLIAGNPDEDSTVLVATIQRFRREYGILESLQELGAELIKESENEPR